MTKDETFLPGDLEALHHAASGRETIAMLNGLFEAARLLPARSSLPDNSVPLTIISGFLGAGKTTLVNRMLNEPDGRRIAVLVNDFGAINIDEELIRSRESDSIGLTNGCACCTVSGDLTRTLIRLLEQPDRPDAIVLEASGLADPHGIAQVALTHPALRLDGVITLVDGETYLERLGDPMTAQTIISQITAADLIVLNKIDLIGESAEAVRSSLRATAGPRTMIEVSHASVPADLVLGIDANRSSFQCVPEGHSAAFATFAHNWDSLRDRASMEDALERLPECVIRAKGVFRFESEPQMRYVYQRVGRRGSLVADPTAPAPSQSRLVVIGAASELRAADVEDALSVAIR